jgi:hypothetical protein
MAFGLTAPRMNFVVRSTGMSSPDGQLTLQAGSVLDVDLVPVGSGMRSAFSPIGTTVSPDGSPRFTGQIRVQFAGLRGSGTGYRVTGFRPGPARLIAASGARILDTVDLMIIGKEASGMVVLDALDAHRLRMSADQVKVLKESINGSKSIIVDQQIVDLLAALLDNGDVDVMSLLRRGAAQHGVVQGDKVFVKAVDLSGFKGTPVISNDGQKLVDLICSMLKLFPKGDFDIGFPRPVGGETGFDPAHDVFFPVRDLAAAKKCWEGKAGGPLSEMLQPARSKVAAAMRQSDATFHVFFPDGLNHLHVNVTKFPTIVADLNV